MQIIGSVPVKQFLFHDLAELVLPSSPLLEEHEDVEMPLDPRFKMAKLMDAFVKKTAQVGICSGHLLEAYTNLP